MLLGMTLWFSATAVNTAIAAEFHLSSGATAWLTMAVQGGFVAGTLVSALLNLPDVINARRLMAIGSVGGALGNALAVGAATPIALIAMRVATGFFLAWVYPPGMKVAAGWFRERRGAALGVLIGALTIGSAFPHLLAAASASVPWRELMLSASACAILGGAIAVVGVGDGPYVAASAPFDAHAILRVFAHRPARLATLGYLGHMWELYAVWTWIAAFAAASIEAAEGGAARTSGSALAFLTIGSGAVGSVAAGLFADRVGKARTAAAAMLVSGTCAALAGFAFTGGLAALAILAVIWGVAVVADSAQLSALVAEHSPRDHVGTALTMQTCSGFLLTMISIRLVPAVARTAGWQWAFLCLAPGPFIGAYALRGLGFSSSPSRPPPPPAPRPS